MRHAANASVWAIVICKFNMSLGRCRLLRHQRLVWAIGIEMFYISDWKCKCLSHRHLEYYYCIGNMYVFEPSTLGMLIFHQGHWWVCDIDVGTVDSWRSIDLSNDSHVFQICVCVCVFVLYRLALTVLLLWHIGEKHTISKPPSFRRPRWVHTSVLSPPVTYLWLSEADRSPNVSKSMTDGSLSDHNIKWWDLISRNPPRALRARSVSPGIKNHLYFMRKYKIPSHRRWEL